MTDQEHLANALAAGFTEAQFKALTPRLRIDFMSASAAIKQATTNATMAAMAVETIRLQRKRLIVGGTGALPGEAT